MAISAMRCLKDGSGKRRRGAAFASDDALADAVMALAVVGRELPVGRSGIPAETNGRVRKSGMLVLAPRSPADVKAAAAPSAASTSTSGSLAAAVATWAATL
jgi:hypothetical protein